MVAKLKLNSKEIHEAAKENTYKAMEDLISLLYEKFDPYNDEDPICFEVGDEGVDDLMEGFDEDIEEFVAEIRKSPNEYNKERVNGYIKKAKHIFDNNKSVVENWFGGGGPMEWMSFD